MNDFTKEELEEMKGWADYSVGSGLCYREAEPLYTKLQSMIDNYCEHKNQEMDVDWGISMQCKDCGTITMDVM